MEASPLRPFPRDLGKSINSGNLLHKLSDTGRRFPAYVRFSLPGAPTAAATAAPTAVTTAATLATSATTTAAFATAKAAAPTAVATFGAGAGFINVQRTPAEVRSVHSGDRGRSLILIRHFDKSEPA